MNWPMSRNSKTEHRMNSGRFNNRTKSLIHVNTCNLSVVIRHKASLVAIKTAICIMLVPKEPQGTNNVRVPDTIASDYGVSEEELGLVVSGKRCGAWFKFVIGVDVGIAKTTKNTEIRIVRLCLEKTGVRDFIIYGAGGLKKKLGSEPSEEQLATSMRISRTNLRTIQIECTLARQKLTLSNVRLVMSIAQRYDNMGAQMTDLIQGGLIGLLRGIERYDSSRGFKMSTYVYWWIRQGVSRALMENSRIQRLPTHLHERQSAIRNAKVKLEEQGITPSIDAITKVFSLDRRANGHLGQTLDTVSPMSALPLNAINFHVMSTLDQSYGVLTDLIIGLSREGVRKIGLAAIEKLKHAAKKTRLEAMLVKH
ncbi:RNA polymerase sigma factor sigA-like protein [Tanacetum coccineum]